MSPRQFAELLNTSIETVYRWESRGTLRIEVEPGQAAALRVLQSLGGKAAIVSPRSWEYDIRFARLNEDTKNRVRAIAGIEDMTSADFDAVVDHVLKQEALERLSAFERLTGLSTERPDAVRLLWDGILRRPIS